jgi:Fe2+ or Zn2+ uptake regulation protein
MRLILTKGTSVEPSRHQNETTMQTHAHGARHARADTSRAAEPALPPHDAAVLAALSDLRTHPTAAELYDAVRRRYPRIGRATVYRALRRLEAAGLAVEVTRDSFGRHYDARTDRHDHAVCTRCGRVLDLAHGVNLPHKLMAQLEAIAYEAGVTVASYELRLYGLCAGCRERSEPGADAADARRPIATVVAPVTSGVEHE